jgi:hypothetical protein
MVMARIKWYAATYASNVTYKDLPAVASGKTRDITKVFGFYQLKALYKTRNKACDVIMVLVEVGGGETDSSKEMWCLRDVFHHKLVSDMVFSSDLSPVVSDRSTLLPGFTQGYSSTATERTAVEPPTVSAPHKEHNTRKRKRE